MKINLNRYRFIRNYGELIYVSICLFLFIITRELTTALAFTLVYFAVRFSKNSYDSHFISAMTCFKWSGITFIFLTYMLIQCEYGVIIGIIMGGIFGLYLKDNKEVFEK